MNPYRDLAAGLAAALEQGRTYPLGEFPPVPRPAVPPGAPKALIFAPHPDDECVIGALPLRLLREGRMEVINVAVTQGSRKDRQAARFAELQAACRFLGFGLVQTAPNGLENVNPATRERDLPAWKRMVGIVAELLRDRRPEVVFYPHARDWNSTHIGVNLLLGDALAEQGPTFGCFVVETEFWGQLDDPNLMVESTPEDVGDLMAATSFHVGEVQRNPYHLVLPAWMIDNVRRGGELVGGQGQAPPDFDFATLYRLTRWSEGRQAAFYEGGKHLGASEDPLTLLTRE